MALQMAHRMDDAPGGSCSGVWQWEQLISIIVAYGPNMMRRTDLIEKKEARRERPSVEKMGTEETEGGGEADDGTQWRS